jgi:glycosyltransferase involved in cell wall biosynthesis
VKYLNWPGSYVIYNGADHYGHLYEPVETETSGPIRILAVTRYRKGEWKYKGLDQIVRLKKDLGSACQITVIGRGDGESAQILKDAGIEVPGIVSDRELARHYSCCDALVSFSQWELFNLPLAEAGFAHKPALALNLCAHPEVTPFAFDSYEAICDYLKKSTRESLRNDGEKMFAHVDSRFRWKQNGEELVKLIQAKCPNPASCRPSFGKGLFWLFWNAREMVRQNIYKKWIKKT